MRNEVVWYVKNSITKELKTDAILFININVINNLFSVDIKCAYNKFSTYITMYGAYQNSYTPIKYE